MRKGSRAGPNGEPKSPLRLRKTYTSLIVAHVLFPVNAVPSIRPRAVCA